MATFLKRAAHSVLSRVSLNFDFFKFLFFPVLVLRAGLVI